MCVRSYAQMVNGVETIACVLSREKLTCMKTTDGGWRLHQAWVEALSQDMQIGCPSLGTEDGVHGMSEGNKCSVTPETVNELCSGSQLAEAVEALGVLVQTDCCDLRTGFYTVLKECAGQKDLVLGRRVHAFAERRGYQSDTFLGNHILRMYASHGKLQEAMDVFAVVVEPDAFTWSAIISAHVKHGHDREAIELYRRMRRSSVKPDGRVFVAALQACARESDLETGQQVHTHILASGVEPVLFVWNSLVNMYSKCGSLGEARRVFDGLGVKDVVTWTAMIAGYAQQGMGQEALRLYSRMQGGGMTAPNSVTFVCLLQACASVGAPALEEGRQLHEQIRRLGHEEDAFVGNSLVNMYAKCGSLEDAHRVFDGLGRKDVVTWNVMIAGHSQQGMGEAALRLYTAMQERGTTVPDSVTFLSLLQACASVGPPALEIGKQLHTQIKVQGRQADRFVANSLVNMYAKCGSLEDAKRVFQGLGQRDVVTWNAMIAGLSQQGMAQEALRLYDDMQDEGISVPSSVTFVCLLQACAAVGTPALETGKQLHAQIKEQGHEADVFVANSLVNMYAKCGSVRDAQRLFDGIACKDVVMWNALIAGYSQQGMGQEALCMFSAMQEEGMALPDAVTFVCLLQACASVGTMALEKGRHIHTQIRERGFQADVFVASSLVNMYAKCGSLEDAQRAFDGLGQKDAVTWTAMIAGYSQQNMGQEALRLYSAMQEEGIAVPDAVTFVCLLQACADVAALHVGRQLHVQIGQQGLQADSFVGGSLINMYGKCGSMVDAHQVFDALPERDVVAWSALIAGYTCQGDCNVVFDLFQKMGEDGILPVGITFLSVLTACSHAGLVNKGREYFEAMSGQYGISPTVEHYICMVDLLGRAGQLDEALALIRTMPFLPNAPVWHTLMSACRKWSNTEVGKYAFDQAVKVDSKDDAAYMMMSNMYTCVQMSEEAQKLQERRTRISAGKQPGQSWWTDTNGVVHSFLVGDEKHIKSQTRLNDVYSQVNEEYVSFPDSSMADIFDSMNDRSCEKLGTTKSITRFAAGRAWLSNYHQKPLGSNAVNYLLGFKLVTCIQG